MTAAGFDKHPEHINRNGRPKRPTILELLYKKFDKNPKELNEIIENIITLMKRKDKDMIKEFWHQVDGLPKQSTDLTSGGEKLEGLVIIKDASTTK